MKIVSWNVAGLSTILSQAKYHHGSYAAFIQSLNADVICLQEAKIQQDKLGTTEAVIDGFESFWTFSTGRRGYSGVVTYVRDKYSPIAADGKPFQNPEFDDEGRCLVTDHGDFVIANVYVPNAGDGPDRPRLYYKMSFLRALADVLSRYKALGKSVVLVGDLNMAHTAQDVSLRYRAKPYHGYSEEEIEWMDALVVNRSTSLPVEGTTKLLLVDVWRVQNPTLDNRFTVWNQRTEARARNEGFRIDYILPDIEFYSKYIRDAAGMPATSALEMKEASNVLQSGVAAMLNTGLRWSDHAAILLTCLDPPAPPPHELCSLSSRKLARLRRPGANIKTMFAVAKESVPVVAKSALSGTEVQVIPDSDADRCDKVQPVESSVGQKRAREGE